MIQYVEQKRGLCCSLQTTSILLKMDEIYRDILNRYLYFVDFANNGLYVSQLVQMPVNMHP